MAEKVFISKNNTVSLICPKCETSKKENISEYLNNKEAVHLKHQCRCGYLHTVLLERRERHRKPVKLSGEYEGTLATGQSVKGQMTVKDISRAGLKFLVNEDEKQHFVAGDKLLVTFHLDDNQKTLIEKEVVVRNIRGTNIGVEYSSVDLYDRALGCYMFVEY